MKPSLAAGLIASALFAASGAPSHDCGSLPAHGAAGIARNIKVPVIPASQPVAQCHYSAQ